MSRLAFWSLLLTCTAAEAQTPVADPYRPRVGDDSGPVRGYGGGVVDTRHPYESVPTYALSTAPPAYPPPAYSGYGYGSPYQVQSNYGSALQGIASVTAATGQYYQDIQSARITRYQANDAALDSARKTIQFERDYERSKQEAWKQDLENEKRTRLDRARRDAPNNEIWSGATFNTLLKSILTASGPVRGAVIPVESRIINGLNFFDKTSRGNLAMAKDEGKIDWSYALEAEAFTPTRNRFNETYAAALSAARSGARPKRDDITSLQKDLKRLDDLLVDEVGNMSPGDYTTSRRLLNQLKGTVTGLTDPSTYKTAFAGKSRLRSVGDVVAYCRDNGLEFGPAVAPGDNQAYSTFYYAIRDFERAVSAGSR